MMSSGISDYTTICLHQSSDLAKSPEITWRTTVALWEKNNIVVDIHIDCEEKANHYLSALIKHNYSTTRQVLLLVQPLETGEYLEVKWEYYLHNKQSIQPSRLHPTYYPIYPTPSQTQGLHHTDPSYLILILCLGRKPDSNAIYKTWIYTKTCCSNCS